MVVHPNIIKYYTVDGCDSGKLYPYYSDQHCNFVCVSGLARYLCLGAHAQARYTVVCLCVCLSVCVDCYSCSRINEVQVRVSIGF